MQTRVVLTILIIENTPGAQLGQGFTEIFPGIELLERRLLQGM